MLVFFGLVQVWGGINWPVGLVTDRVSPAQSKNDQPQAGGQVLISSPVIAVDLVASCTHTHSLYEYIHVYGTLAIH